MVIVPAAVLEDVRSWNKIMGSSASNKILGFIVGEVLHLRLRQHQQRLLRPLPGAQGAQGAVEKDSFGWRWAC